MSDIELDQVKRAEICTILAFGGTRDVAAHYVGCDPNAVQRLASRDRDFRKQLRQAESRMEIMHLKNLRESASSKPFWRAAAWILERRFPQRYFLRSPDTVTVEQISQVLHNLVDVIASEVPDAEHRQRIVSRMDGVVGQLQRSRSRKKTK